MSNAHDNHECSERVGSRNAHNEDHVAHSLSHTIPEGNIVGGTLLAVEGGEAGAHAGHADVEHAGEHNFGGCCHKIVVVLHSNFN